MLPPYKEPKKMLNKHFNTIQFQHVFEGTTASVSFSDCHGIFVHIKGVKMALNERTMAFSHRCSL